jgi:ABC-type transport system substrate-binding protein
MSRIKSIIALLLALVMVLGMVACGGGTSDTTTTQAPSSSGGDTTEPAGDAEVETTNTPIVTSSINLSPSTYDMYAETVDKIDPTLDITVGITSTFGGAYNPQGEQGTQAPSMLMALVYDYLYNYDGDQGNTRYSRILKDWYQQDDTTFVMELYPNIEFRTNDGVYATMTGEDVLFSMQSYVTQASMFGSHFEPYNFDKSYVSDDGLTVYLISDEPYGPFVRTFPIICKKWVEENGWDSPLWETDPCGSGPYTAGDFVSGASVSVTIRDDWWNSDYRQTPVKTYTARIYNETSTMYIDLEMGAIDIALQLVSQDYDRAVADQPENVQVEKFSSAVLWFLGIGGSQGQSPYLADIKVREAIAHAVDWVAVGKACFGSMWGEAPGIVSPNLTEWYVEGLSTTYTYDPDYAKQLLEEAGYKDGEIVINNVNFGKQASVAEAMQGYLSAVGITFNVETYEFLTCLQSWLGVGEPACDTAFNDQTDAAGDPCDNIGFYSTYTASSFPVLTVEDEYWNEQYYKLLHSNSGRQEILDDLVTYVHDNYLFYPVGLCYESYGYRTDVIVDANFANAEYGPDLALAEFVY